MSSGGCRILLTTDVHLVVVSYNCNILKCSIRSASDMTVILDPYLARTRPETLQGLAFTSIRCKTGISSSGTFSILGFEVNEYLEKLLFPEKGNRLEQELDMFNIRNAELSYHMAKRRSLNSLGSGETKFDPTLSSHLLLSC